MVEFVASKMEEGETKEERLEDETKRRKRKRRKGGRQINTQRGD